MVAGVRCGRVVLKPTERRRKGDGGALLQGPDLSAGTEACDETRLGWQEDRHQVEGTAWGKRRHGKECQEG